MSDSGSERRPKRTPPPAPGDDPWAKWRKPEAPVAAPAGEPPRRAASPVAGPAAVNAEKRPKSQPPSAAAVKAAVPVTPVAASAEAPAQPVGTLGVRKSATSAPRAPNRKPLRGGPAPRKPASPKAAPVLRPAPVARTPVSRDGPPPEGVRLSKIMSERAMCSRREADLWIERGWVFVDGERVSELGSRIKPDAEITISKEAEKDQAKQVTILLNKPVGYVSGQPEADCIPAVTLIQAGNQVRQSGDAEFKPWMLRGLAPAGRLDIDSTGLLVLTQDGRVAKKLIGEDSQAEKEYLVRVSGELVPNGLKLLQHGLELDGKPLKPAWVKQLNEDQLHFILKEGKKRQIRRMCELVGLQVTGLKRVRIGRVRLGDLPLGHWRFLRTDESF